MTSCLELFSYPVSSYTNVLISSCLPFLNVSLQVFPAFILLYFCWMSPFVSLLYNVNSSAFPRNVNSPFTSLNEMSQGTGVLLWNQVSWLFSYSMQVSLEFDWRLPGQTPISCIQTIGFKWNLLWKMLNSLLIRNMEVCLERKRTLPAPQNQTKSTLW